MSEVKIKEMGPPFPFVPLTSFGARKTSSDPPTEMTQLSHPGCSSYLCVAPVCCQHQLLVSFIGINQTTLTLLRAGGLFLERVATGTFLSSDFEDFQAMMIEPFVAPVTTPQTGKSVTPSAASSSTPKIQYI